MKKLAIAALTALVATVALSNVAEAGWRHRYHNWDGYNRHWDGYHSHWNGCHHRDRYNDYSSYDY